MANNQNSLGIKLRIYLLGLAIILFIFIVVGILTYLTNFSNQTIGFGYSFLAGLSMLFLPTTLPLVFLIAPITMNETPKKGIIMALFFAAGMLITSTVYEFVLINSGGEMDVLTVTFIAVIVGGVWVYILGLSEIGLINMNALGLESASHNTHEHADYLKVFLLGFSLASVTFWFQNPIFYFLHMDIRDTADIFTGGSIALAYHLGKATSLIIITTLGIIVINAISGIRKVFITQKNDSVTNVTDWGLLFIGAFLLTFGGLFRRWYVESTFYLAWNDMLITLSGGRIGEVLLFSSKADAMLDMVPQWQGPYVFILLLAIPIILHFYKNSQKFSKFKEKPT